MHGLVSLLPEPYYSRVTGTWRQLKERHGLTGIEVTPYPHFSWQIGVEYPFEALQAALAEVCAAGRPFKVRTTGLGLFTGPAPVLFIPVVKNQALLDFHARVWERLLPVVQGASPYYDPDHWCPHISLAYGDLTPANIGPLMEALAFESYNWEFEVDNLAFIYEPDGTVGEVKLRYRLGG